MTKRELTVDGKPIAQPRAQRSANGRMFQPRQHPVVAWRELIGLKYRLAFPGEPLAGPVAVALVFLLPLPKGRQRKRKAVPRQPHIVKPDPDNLAKAVLDALSGLAWSDDRQVFRLDVAKYTAGGNDSPGVNITIEGF